MFSKTIVSFSQKSIVFKTNNSFWTFRKRITIVFESDRFHKNDLRQFFIRLFLKKRSLLKRRSLLTILLKIVNEGLSLTIVKEMTKFIKMVFLEKRSFLKKLHAMSSYMKLNSCGELKLFDIFLKLNDKFRCPSGQFPLFVNDR